MTPTCPTCKQPLIDPHICKPAGYWQALAGFLGVQAAQRGLPPCGFCDKPMAECTCDEETPTR